MQSYISLLLLPSYIIIAESFLTTHSLTFTTPTIPSTNRFHSSSPRHCPFNYRHDQHQLHSLSPKHETPNADDETPSYFYYRPQSRPTPQGGPFAYTEPNIRRSASTFLSIRSIGGVDCTNDVYARSPNRFEYWYIGKIARTDGTVGLEEAVSKCWNMMEEHAVRLRPVELGREFGNLEIWVARGDSELEMSQAAVVGSGSDGSAVERFRLKKMQRYVEGSEDVNVLEVGFMAEFVTNSGQGFYIVRNERGEVMQ